MPFTLEQYFREFVEKHGDEFLALFSPQMLLKHLSIEERRAGLSREGWQRVLDCLNASAAPPDLGDVDAPLDKRRPR